MIQLHLAIIYLACGVEKSMGPDWWNGEAIWCALMRRDLCAFDMSWLANVPWLPKMFGLGTLLVETGYPLLISSRRTRTFWALLTINLHFGIFVFMRLYSFSAVMAVFTASAFLVSADPSAAAIRIPLLSFFRRNKAVETVACGVAT